MSPELAAAAREMSLSAAAQSLVAAQPSLRAAVQELMGAGLHQDALALLARSLPRRYVVAWVCETVRAAAPQPEDLMGLAVAERWLRDPREETRRAAFDFADADGYSTLAGWIAAGAGWSDGSLAPPGQGVVPPPPALTAQAGVAALSLLAARDPAQFGARRAAYVERALRLIDARTA